MNRTSLCSLVLFVLDQSIESFFMRGVLSYIGASDVRYVLVIVFDFSFHLLLFFLVAAFMSPSRVLYCASDFLIYLYGKSSLMPPAS